MNNIQEMRWMQSMECGKKALAENRCVEATRHFTMAVRHAVAFGDTDIRKGVAMSWAAVGYYKMSTFSIAEALFKDSMDLLDFNLSSEYSVEIACNLKNLVAIYRMNGRAIESLQVMHVIRRHLLEAGFEGGVTMNLVPPPAKQRPETRNDADVAQRGLARLFEARKLKSMKAEPPSFAQRIRLTFNPNGQVN